MIRFEKKPGIKDTSKNDNASSAKIDDLDKNRPTSKVDDLGPADE